MTQLGVFEPFTQRRARRPLEYSQALVGSRSAQERCGLFDLMLPPPAHPRGFAPAGGRPLQIAGYAGSGGGGRRRPPPMELAEVVSGCDQRELAADVAQGA